MAEDSGEHLDSWEDQVDSGVLDERLKKISVSSTTGEESRLRAQPVMMQEETGRTEYKPQVRILKREPNSNANSAPGNSPRTAKVNKPMKTLEQREAEYAEARMRIFGSAGTEPEAESNSSAGALPSAPADKQYKVNKTETKTANAIIRQPLGPDGSSGFHSNR